MPCIIQSSPSPGLTAAPFSLLLLLLLLLLLVVQVTILGEGPGPRAGHTATLLDRRMLIFGGSHGPKYLSDM
jgi:hypothetical protein